MPLSTPNFEYTTTNIPAFLSKLWTLVEDPKYDELIAWDPAGFSFHVYDQTRFSREILPRFFKHNNMASFIRQLNMYGFRKVNSIDHGSLKSEKEDMEFHHPYFMRGKEQFLEFIKRKVPDLKMAGQSMNSIAAPATTTASSALQIQYPQIKAEELSKVLDDVNSMKSRQKVVDDSIFNMKKENEALWKEIASLRQKHHHQQQIVNKLIHFLVHLVNPSSLGLKRTRPLMIDSHSAAKFSNIDDAIELSELDDEGKTGLSSLSDHDDDELIIATSKPPKSRQIVEIEDFDENGPIVTEIETIDKSSFMGKKRAEECGGGLVTEEADQVPAAKRLKPTDEGKNGDSSKELVSAPTTAGTNGSFLNPSIFLNTPSAAAAVPTIELPPSNMTMQSSVNSPIVSTPGSPALDNRTDSSSSGGVCVNQISSSNVPAPAHPNVMNDHVESLQFDLNSIKEFLTQNSFNTIDPYTINNLFSPIVLDQMDNDVAPFYIEGASAATADNTRNGNNGTASNAVVAGSNGTLDTVPPPLADSSESKLVGGGSNSSLQSQKSQSGTINLGDYFNLDEIFTADQKHADEQPTPAAAAADETERFELTTPAPSAE